MTSRSNPVFYDCEASSLDGFVIEIGWAFVDPMSGDIVSASYLVRPFADWDIEVTWDENAEALHGISLAELRSHGLRVHDIAREMNRALVGRELYSDSAFDEAWLGQIFDGAGIVPSFTVRQMGADTLLQQAIINRNGDLGRYFDDLARAEQSRCHRASADAILWAQLWKNFMQDKM